VHAVAAGVAQCLCGRIAKRMVWTESKCRVSTPDNSVYDLPLVSVPLSTWSAQHRTGGFCRRTNGLEFAACAI